MNESSVLTKSIPINTPRDSQILRSNPSPTNFTNLPNAPPSLTSPDLLPSPRGKNNRAHIPHPTEWNLSRDFTSPFAVVELQLLVDFFDSCEVLEGALAEMEDDVWNFVKAQAPMQA